MKKAKTQITSDYAIEMMFDTLSEEHIEDRIYEFAQELFDGYIAQIEDNNEITDKDKYDSGEEWYDEIREEFFQAVYDKMLGFLKNGE